MSSALLVAAVGGILLAGLALKSGKQPAGVRVTSRPGTPAPVLGSSIAAEAAPPFSDPEPDPVDHGDALPVPTEDPALVRLAMRVEADCARLSRSGGRWTAQLLVACKPETVDRILEASVGVSRLYVLPARVHDDACFRVCYGSYASAKEAAAAVDLPSSLRGREKIGAVEIAKVLP